MLAITEKDTSDLSSIQRLGLRAQRAPMENMLIDVLKHILAFCIVFYSSYCLFFVLNYNTDFYLIKKC